MTQERIIVVGGGAAGLMAAGIAAEGGRDVLILEKMATPARKLRITGKGRCNLTNDAPLPEFLSHFGKSGKFLRQAFGRFFSRELIDFFESRGLQVVHERGGRVFPFNNDAPAVAALLVDWVKQSGAELVPGCRVSELLIEDGQAAGVRCGDMVHRAGKVILATGGKSYPRTGSTGDGYRLADAVGHTIVSLRPALVSLKTDKGQVQGLDGLTLRNVKASLFIDRSRKVQAFGELTFVEDGFSGPIVLTMSGLAVDALAEGRAVEVRLDLKPALDDRKLDDRLIRDLQKRLKEPMESVLRGLVPRELVPLCLAALGSDPDLLAGQFPAEQRKRLRLWLKDLRFPVIGHGSWEEAIVTSGGVKTTEVDPKTMESKKVAGLYIVGELLDIQADTGGYNLQAAFSTGWLAGKAVIAEKLASSPTRR